MRDIFITVFLDIHLRYRTIGQEMISHILVVVTKNVCSTATGNECRFVY